MKKRFIGVLLALAALGLMAGSAMAAGTSWDITISAFAGDGNNIVNLGKAYGYSKPTYEMPSSTYLGDDIPATKLSESPIKDVLKRNTATLTLGSSADTVYVTWTNNNNGATASADIKNLYVEAKENGKTYLESLTTSTGEDPSEDQFYVNLSDKNKMKSEAVNAIGHDTPQNKGAAFRLEIGNIFKAGTYYVVFDPNSKGEKFFTVRLAVAIEGAAVQTKDTLDWTVEQLKKVATWLKSIIGDETLEKLDIEKPSDVAAYMKLLEKIEAAKAEALKASDQKIKLALPEVTVINGQFYVFGVDVSQLNLRSGDSVELHFYKNAVTGDAFSSSIASEDDEDYVDATFFNAENGKIIQADELYGKTNVGVLADFGYDGEVIPYFVTDAHGEEPVDPSNPSSPGELSNPSEPSNPSNPSEPGSPSTPGSPSSPSNPSNPSGSSKPKSSGSSGCDMGMVSGLAILLAALLPLRKVRK